jgi:hypothetical protein
MGIKHPRRREGSKRDYTSKVKGDGYRLANF